MNRRSMLSVAFGACASVLFPWRKTETREERVHRMLREACMRQGLDPEKYIKYS